MHHRSNDIHESSLLLLFVRVTVEDRFESSDAARVSRATRFDPWFDDLEPPFRMEPIIAVSPSGATVGLAANW